LIALVSILSIISTCIIYTNFVAREIKVIPIELLVGKTIGFNTDTDILKFGTIPPGYQGARYINISNSESFPMKVKLSIDGEVTGWFRTDKNNFMLQEGGQENIKIIADVPKDALHGNYSGNLYVIFSRR
jgi:hypothetical protein